MRKILSLAAAVASVFVMGAAQADIVLIDNFNAPGVVAQITDNTIGGPVVSMTHALAAPNLASSRTITVNQTTNNSTAPGAGITATVGGGTTGVLDISVASRTNGTATVAWTIPEIIPPLGNPASYFFNVLFSALGSTASLPVLNNIDFTFSGGAGSFSLLNQTIGATNSATPVTFSLTPGQATILTGGGVLAMNLSGGDAWNLVLDSFSISIPEPTSLALVGLALVGAGVLSRRRKA